MEISKKDIKCKAIVEQVEQYTSSIRQFIRLVNRQMPKGKKLNKENIIILREEHTAYLNDGNTPTEGYSYEVYWSYTSKQEETTKADIINLSQKNAVTFILNCYERCYDHSKDRLMFFSLYYNNSSDKAERVDYINDNYDKNYLFMPYEITQVVWRLKRDLNIYHSNIPENQKMIEKYAKVFEKGIHKLEIGQSYTEIKRKLPQWVKNNIESFETQANIFAKMIFKYVAISAETTKSELEIYLKEHECSDILLNEMIDLDQSIQKMKENGKLDIKTFRWQKDEHLTFDENERENTFSMYNCIKCIFGYSYFNKYVFLQGIAENWHPRLLYFSYYLSKDLKEAYYTISMTSFEGRFRKNYMNLIEAKTLEKLLSAENAMKVARWLEEICEKTKMVNYYSSIIAEEKIRNFNSTRDIDR